jgi:hypothetical protein
MVTRKIMLICSWLLFEPPVGKHPEGVALGPFSFWPQDDSDLLKPHAIIELKMEQLLWVCFLEHEFHLLIWFYVLDVRPVCVENVLRVLLRDYQDAIHGLRLEKRDGHIAGVEGGVDAGVHQLAGLVGVHSNGQAHRGKWTGPHKEVLSFQFAQFDVVQMLIGLIDVDIS